MPITTAHLKFIGAAKINDDDDAGGVEGTTVLQDGLSNNLFADLNENDRVQGRLHLRKVYAAVLSPDNDLAAASKILLTQVPSDPAIEVAAFRTGDEKTTRLQAALALASLSYDSFKYGTHHAMSVKDSATLPSDEARYGPATTEIEVGDLIADCQGWVPKDGQSFVVNRVVRVTALLGTGSFNSVAVQHVRFVPFSPAAASSLHIVDAAGQPPQLQTLRYAVIQPAPADAGCVGRALLGVAAAATDTVVSVDRVQAQVVPFNGTNYPTTSLGIAPGSLRMFNGRVPIFRPGDMVYIEHATVPGTNEVRVVEKVLFDGRLRFTAGLANAYPVGSKLCSMSLGADLQASVNPVFSQQTWTRTFSDTLIGNSISAQYNRAAGDILVTNEGAITERWAVVFTSATAFKLIGERLGQIATGVTTANFLPLNPMTNTPYFTLQSAAWGAGWGIGNVLRFNTRAAKGPFWVSRCVSPSAPGGGTTQATVASRVTVNA